MADDLKKIHVVYELENGSAIHATYPDDNAYRADSSCRRGVRRIHDNLSFEEADALFLRLNEARAKTTDGKRQEPERPDLGSLV